MPQIVYGDIAVYTKGKYIPQTRYNNKDIISVKRNIIEIKRFPTCLPVPYIKQIHHLRVSDTSQYQYYIN